MKSVLSTNPNFKRCPDLDYSGFRSFRVGQRLIVSESIHEDRVFITVILEENKVPYTTYSKLPHFFELQNLDGAKVSEISVEAVQKFYQNCLAFENEYETSGGRV